MVAKISFALAYNVMLMSQLSSLRHKTSYAYAYVVVRTRLNSQPHEYVLNKDYVQIRSK